MSGGSTTPQINFLQKQKELREQLHQQQVRSILESQTVDRILNILLLYSKHHLIRRHHRRHHHNHLNNTIVQINRQYRLEDIHHRFRSVSLVTTI